MPQGFVRLRTRGLLFSYALASTVLIFSAESSNAQTVPYAFAGSVVITAVQGNNCDGVNVQAGELHTSIYRPAQTGIGTATLQLLQDQAAFRMVPSGGGDFVANGQYSATMFTGRGGLIEYTGNYGALKIRPIPTPTTPVIDISGKLTNFKNGGSCTVTFAGGYVLKPGS